MGHCSGVGLHFEGGALLGWWAPFRVWGSAHRRFKMLAYLNSPPYRVHAELNYWMNHYVLLFYYYVVIIKYVHGMGRLTYSPHFIIHLV